MPRFVLLYHDCPPHLGKPSHWDLMLERDGVLLTWSLAALPATWRDEGETAEEQLAATRLADHRIEYLDYEGPLSGDRGAVMRIDQGEYDLLDESDDGIRIRLRGERRQGVEATLPR